MRPTTVPWGVESCQVAHYFSAIQPEPVERAFAPVSSMAVTVRVGVIQPSRCKNRGRLARRSPPQRVRVGGLRSAVSDKDITMSPRYSDSVVQMSSICELGFERAQRRARRFACRAGELPLRARRAVLSLKRQFIGPQSAPCPGHLLCPVGNQSCHSSRYHSSAVCSYLGIPQLVLGVL
jgi:hypothetical protein